jgi:ribosomal protein S18 acetylase RimI-like enzyme
LENQSLQICRLVVHPNFFRRGIGRKLVQYIFEKYGDVETFAVSTGDLNKPAKKLYTILGFHETKKVEISPNVFIACFEKG